MLTALSIRDIVLVDSLDLEVEGGLTVLTGETGAGKSIILDALGLALVDEVGQTFRAAIREVRRHEFEKGGAIPGSVRIFLDAVERHRSQFVFLAREQFGGSATVRQALRQLRRHKRFGCIRVGLGDDVASVRRQRLRHRPQRDGRLLRSGAPQSGARLLVPRVRQHHHLQDRPGRATGPGRSACLLRRHGDPGH